MKSLVTKFCLASAFVAAPAAQAQIVLSDNFDSGIGAWTVSGQVSAFSVGTTTQARFFGIPLNPSSLTRDANILIPDFYRISFSIPGLIDNSLAPGYSFTAALGGTTLFTLNDSILAAPPSRNIPFFRSAFVSAAAGADLVFTASGGGVGVSPLNGGVDIRLDNVVVERVPGPLPVLGALAAFGWTRKLRKKIKLADAA